MDQSLKMLLTPTIKKINVEKRTVRFIGTSETRDRTGDVIEVAGWQLNNFLKNPVFLWDHNASILPIGKVLSIIRDGLSLVFDVEFATKELNAHADAVFNMFRDGFLSAVSVGFMPKKVDLIVDSETEEITGLRFVEQELLELSAVNVPAHQDALAFNGDKQMLAAYQALVEEAKQHPTKKSFMSLEDFHKQHMLGIEKELASMEANEEDEEVMKEKIEALEAQVKDMGEKLDSLVSLKEVVDLSKTTMDTLNKTIVSLLRKEDHKGLDSKETPAATANEPKVPAFDVSKLTEALDGLQKRLSEKSFKPKGE
jgi:HK97 family phage prohead protease